MMIIIIMIMIIIIVAADKSLHSSHELLQSDVVAAHISLLKHIS